MGKKKWCGRFLRCFHCYGHGKRLLVASPLKPFVWKTFIFSLWKIPIEEVSILVNFANSFHPTINFTCEMSSERVVFLDTEVFKGPLLSTLKPGSHLCNKHNASEISISISTTISISISISICFFFYLSYAYCTSVKQALEFSIHKPISSPLKLFSIHTSHPATHSLRKRVYQRRSIMSFKQLSQGGFLQVQTKL